MINLSFYLNWPWFKNNYDGCKDYFYKSWSMSKHKTLELQISRGGNAIIGSSFHWSVNCDHAGVMFDIALFRRFLHVSLCDNRHWDHKNNCWEKYE